MTYALGIDLGTTFTAAAVARSGRVEIVGLGNHAAAIPSAVLLREDGELLVGDAAIRRGQQEPARLAKEFKRRLGDATPIILGHTPYSSERLMAMIVRWVVDAVSERNGGPPASVTIAHPANWGPYKRELLQQAAALAGLDSVRYVSEPEAAAVHFAAGERVDEGGVVAVYDLGGGTFDAAVLRRVDGRFVTLGEPQGIERLGGIDFDEAVFSHVRQTLGAGLTSLDLDDPSVRASVVRLREECVAAKEALSDDSEAIVPVMLPGLQTSVRITRPEFEQMIRPVLRETVTMLQRAIQLAGVTSAGLSAVVLAGGSSRIPLVAEMVSEALGRPVSVDAHPKHTVAMGAARLAADPSTAAASKGPAAVPPPAPAVVPPPPVSAIDPAVGSPSVPAAQSPSSDLVPPAPAPPPTSSGSGPTPPRRTVPTSAAASPGPDPARDRPWAKGAVALVVIAVVAAVAGFLIVRSRGGDSDTTGDDSVPEATVGVVATLPGTTDGDSAIVVTTTIAQTTEDTEPVDTEADTEPTETDQTDATVTTATNDSTVRTTIATPCAGANGNCVTINSITANGDELIATYSVVGFEPDLDGGPLSKHIHFYFDTVGVSQAGEPGSGPWVMWDVDPITGQLLYRFRRSEIPEGARQLCASVANVNHGLDDHLSSCRNLPL
ncbi:Hsp70 family protein [Desertimonas flava]|uniref:Hsp70 family protein n=1 Tax=Desertimonas flava TaxID=2064846 RepID=UPI000E34DC36|nr:Hsp70 family protein [Desertimonas flava]